VVPAGAIPNRAEAGIAMAITDASTATVITRIRLIVVSSSRQRSCRVLPQCPEGSFVPGQLDF
jgi:hypothetical protein